MINVSESFIRKIKRIFKEKNLSLSNYVFCFTCGKVSEDNIVALNFLTVPIEDFEDSNEKLPFSSFTFFKKSNCFMACDTGAFLYLINKKLTANKNGEAVFTKAPKRGKNSYCGFIGKCFVEHMKNEKLSKRELARNIGMTVNKLNLIIKGETGNVNLDEMVSISFEFQGRHKISRYHVMVEKDTIKNKSY